MPPQPGGRRRAAAISAAALMLLGGCTSGKSPAPAEAAEPTSTAAAPLTGSQAAEAFLASYVDDSGRVVRLDQGGDTVSEGQAYAMLAAAAVSDRGAFDRVWSWTKQNLRRPDGLLSWRWSDGAVVDAESASDADLDAARALLVAGRTFADPRLMAEGTELGRLVLDLETVVTGAGRILVAGSWATQAPFAYNPSYYSPAATALLAESSGDPRWAELDAGSRAVTVAMLTRADLPPDWAQVRPDGGVDAMPGAQGRGQSVRYGYDAARTPIRLAESCTPTDWAVAAGLTEPLSRAGNAAELDLGGTPLAEGDSVVAAIAQAAVAAAAGDGDGARGHLLDADRIQRDHPTYYGAAWGALGRLILEGGRLGGCLPLGPG
ncbi:glycosyl hydrolase family 8 [Blastococcus sp. CT_GayMR16]|uniref:glycosyl hydrolase family 8 n=1 Tax=Blastococcus sp. CT_GayMR16 TaxID=2559607 RepID=UPI0014317581|nr:glycosyl hydrolase family 8 [Blastococcus sp. CT_GayMR16]